MSDKKTNIQWPGKNAGVEAHLQFFIESMHHVAATPLPDDTFRQMPHGDGAQIGDPKIPAILNASYIYHGVPVISFSIPDFIPFDPLAVMSTAPKAAVKNRIVALVGSFRRPSDPIPVRGMGYNPWNLCTSLQMILGSFGIETEERGGKHDRVSETHYAELNLVNGNQFEYAKALLDTILTGRDKTAPQLLAALKEVGGANIAATSTLTPNDP